MRHFSRRLIVLLALSALIVTGLCLEANAQDGTRLQRIKQAVNDTAKELGWPLGALKSEASPFEKTPGSVYTVKYTDVEISIIDTISPEALPHVKEMFSDLYDLYGEPEMGLGRSSFHGRRALHTHLTKAQDLKFVGGNIFCWEYGPGFACVNAKRYHSKVRHIAEKLYANMSKYGLFGGEKDLVLTFRGRQVAAQKVTDEIKNRTKSWRQQLWLRKVAHRNWLRSFQKHVILYEDKYDSLLADAVKLDRQRLERFSQLPAEEGFKTYSRIEKLMSKYWADASLVMSAATANRIGDFILSWRKSSVTISLSKDVASSLGTGYKHVKVGTITNSIGYLMIVLDFWNNMATAGNPAEAQEAWAKAGYALTDMKLQSFVAKYFGASAALPQMFVSYILTNAYDTLIAGHKGCWWTKFVEQAISEKWLGKDVSDKRAVQKVMAAMRSPEGLEKTISRWWRSESANWEGWLGGCGSWNLADARGYGKEFVNRLLRTKKVKIGGREYRPWSFYYNVARELVRVRKREKLKELAARMVALEAAYLSNLKEDRYSTRFRLVERDKPQVGIPGVRICPQDWNPNEGWKTDDQGYVTIKLDGLEFSPDGSIMLVARPGSRHPLYFALSKEDFAPVKK